MSSAGTTARGVLYCTVPQSLGHQNPISHNRATRQPERLRGGSSNTCATLSRGGAEKEGSRKIEKPVNRRIARPSQAGECFRVGGNTSRGSTRAARLWPVPAFVASSFVAPFLKVLQSFYSTVVLVLYSYSILLYTAILLDEYFFQIYSSIQRAVQAVSRDNIRIERECISFLNSSKLV